MATNPSWLYSTIAQSSAAIVAIIGGFITATVLRLSAEKESLKKQIIEKRRRIESMKASHVDVTIANFSELEKEIPELEKRVKIFSYPPHLKMGTYILGFLSVFGILAPVIIIANQAFNDWAKWLVTGPFWIGIIGVFAYIVYLISSLRRK